MPLAFYREKYWYPNGSPAAGQKLFVFPRNSQSLEPLYSDAAGTIPIPNPVTLPANGEAEFWCENGDKWGFCNGQSFYLVIDTDPALTRVWPATFVHDHPVAEPVWTVDHGLMSKPGVTVLDANDQITQGDVDYVDDNSLTITFGGPIAGTAYLRR